MEIQKQTKQEAKGLTLKELTYLCGYLDRVTMNTYASEEHERNELKKILTKLRKLKR